MVTVVFSLDNTEQKFADLTRNQRLLYFNGLFGLKVTLVKFACQGLEWAFSSLSYYSLWVGRLKSC